LIMERLILLEEAKAWQRERFVLERMKEGSRFGASLRKLELENEKKDQVKFRWLRF